MLKPEIYKSNFTNFHQTFSHVVLGMLECVLVRVFECVCVCILVDEFLYLNVFLVFVFYLFVKG